MALLGENGAGKSTLVKILTGVHRPDAGEIVVDGERQIFANAKAAATAGITAIHQETVMFDELTVAENIMIAHPPRRRPFGAIDWPRLQREGLGAPRGDQGEHRSERPARNHRHRRAAHGLDRRRPRVRCAGADLRRADGRALAQGDQALYVIIRKLRAAGRAIVFISHKFDEIFAIADRYTVLRDGAFVATGRIADTSRDDLVRMMVGRPMTHVYPKADAAIGELALEVDGLSHPTEFRDVSFDVRRGEIVGFYGLVGAGRTEVMEAVFGLTPTASGSIRIGGAAVSMGSPMQAIRQGLAYVPEDRGRNGGILPMSIGANISLAALGRLGRGPFLSTSREAELARRFTQLLSIKAANVAQRLDQLSGGNQRKSGDQQVAGHRSGYHHPRRADQGHRHRQQDRRA